MIPRKHKRLLDLERRNKRTIEAILGYLLLGNRKAPKTRFQLLLQVPGLQRKVRQAILDLHPAAQELANEDADQEDADPFLDPERIPLVTKAASSLVLAVVAFSAVRAQEGQDFPEALEGALEDVTPRVTRIATSETFAAYADQLLANTQDQPGEWVWDALLDRRTCPHCEALNGTIWTRQVDVPACPAHVRCRCIIEFFPSQ